MEITYASSDEERIEVRDFLAEHIAGIAETAVPATAMDYAFKPLVPLIRTEDGHIVAAVPRRLDHRWGLAMATCACP